MNITSANTVNYAENSTATSSNQVKTAEGGAVNTKSAAEAAKEAFAEYMEKTPIEHWREKILEGMGLTEESLAALPPEEMARVEDVIQRKIEQQMKQNAGLNVVV